MATKWKIEIKDKIILLGVWLGIAVAGFLTISGVVMWLRIFGVIK